MDTFLINARSQLRLTEKILRERLKRIEALAVGEMLRRNQAMHTIALITLLEEIQEIASHDPSTWWENNEEVPF